MNSVWYKFRSATIWRELQIPSTFITIGEMRQLICKELHLHEEETVLLSETEDYTYKPLADEKQFPRGSRFWARRTTFDHIRREQVVQEQARSVKEAQTTDSDLPHAQKDDSDDDFGPDLFDRDAQLKYEERERQTHLQAIAEQHRLETEQSIAEIPQDAYVEAVEHALQAKAAVALDPKRASMRLIEEPDDMEIDWARLIEERKSSKAGEVKQECSESPAVGDLGTAATASHSLPATSEPAMPQDDLNTEAKNEASLPHEQPAVPSLLQTCSNLLNMCRHILPDAPLEDLYSAFPHTRPRKRADWEAFQKTLKQRSPAPQPAKPPGTPPSHSPRSNQPRRDISPTDSPAPSPGARRWEPSPQHGSDSGQPGSWHGSEPPLQHPSSRPPRPPFQPLANRSNSPAVRSSRQPDTSASPPPQHPQSSSRSPHRRRHHSKQLSRSPAPAARSRSGTQERDQPASLACGARAHSRPPQHARSASASHRQPHARHLPDYNEGMARGGMRGTSTRAGSNARVDQIWHSTAQRSQKFRTRSLSRSSSPKHTARPETRRNGRGSSSSSTSSSSASSSRSPPAPQPQERSAAVSPRQKGAVHGRRRRSRSTSPGQGPQRRSHRPRRSSSKPSPSRVSKVHARTPPPGAQEAPQSRLEQLSPDALSQGKKRMQATDRGALARKALGGLRR